MEEVQKVLVNEKSMAWITCGQCKHTSAVDLSGSSDGDNIIAYKCLKCEAVFDVACEFRKSYRKAVSLQGTFRQQQPIENQAGRIEITDLSRTGIKFKTRLKYNFQPGYILKLTFTLDDRNKTIVNQTTEVKWACGQLVGGQFIHQDQWTQKQLGFYFMS
jgi:hypothetical protein